jgi:hypothetical protein
MKNLFILSAIAVSLVACSSEGTTSTEQTDSLTAVAPVDTTVADTVAAVVDTTAVDTLAK